MKMRRLIVIFVVLGLLSMEMSTYAASAKVHERGSWDAVKNLNSMDKINIKLIDKKNIKCKFTSASDSSIIVQVNGKDREIKREEIVQLQKYEKKSTKKKTIGLLIAGGAVALGLGVISNRDFSYESFADTRNLAGLIVVGAGTIVGLDVAFLSKKAMLYETHHTTNVSEELLLQQAQKTVIPKYPKELKDKEIKGEVKVKVLVSEKGEVLEATAVSGAQELQSYAIEAAKQWKFKPFVSQDQSSMMEGVLTFSFPAKRNMF